MSGGVNHREEIGRRIAALRQKRGLSLRDLAELTGLDHSNIGKIENGRYNVGIDILGRICDALGCRIELREGR